MKFGTSEPHNCFEEQVKILTEQSTELSTSSPGSVCFPYDAIVETEKLLGTRLLKLRAVIDCELKCCTIGIGFNGAETNC